MDKDIWLTMLDHLQHQDTLPVVASTLSWARCHTSSPPPPPISPPPPTPSTPTATSTTLSTMLWSMARCFGSVLIPAITCCSNTMLGAGLLSRKVVEAGLKWCQLERGRVGERILGAGVVQGGSLYWPHQNLTKSRLIFDTPYTPNFDVASIASVVEIRFP